MSRYPRAAPPPPDPYDLNDPAYDVNNFVTSATADRQQTRVWLPTEAFVRLEQLIQSRDIPEYATVQDAVRDAVYHRLWWLEHSYHPVGIREMLTLWQVHSASELRSKLLAKRRETITTLRNSFDEAKVAGSKTEMAAALVDAERLLALDDDDSDTPFQKDLVSLVARMKDELAR